MKTILSFVVLMFITLTINAQEFKFETEIIDYGTITKGSDGERVYNFINIGDAPIIIKTVKTSCGCLTAKGPKLPIMPGEKGIIKVDYDTYRLGRFSKSITVFSNAKVERKMLKVKGFVVKKESVLTE